VDTLEAHETEDADLLEAWRSGDKAAGETLFLRHYERVSWFFHNKAGEHALDLVQGTFLACLETRDRIRETAAFRSYLFGVARNVLHDHYRRKRRDRAQLDFTQKSAQDLAPSAITLIVKRQEQQLLLAALRRIPVESQIILELIFWEKLTPRELAEVLELKYHTARSRIRTAREQLKKAMRQVTKVPELVKTTLEDLEGWAQRVREDARTH